VESWDTALTDQLAELAAASSVGWCADIDSAHSSHSALQCEKVFLTGA
jgi:hypothetical protein